MPESEKISIRATLVFLCQNDRVLLPIKKDKIGAGCRNGYGGHVEGNETLEQCAVRELKEESGVKASVKHLRKVAVADFHNQKENGGWLVCRVYTFVLDQWKGDPRAGKEMGRPQWFSVIEAPYWEMMPADGAWVPKILTGELLFVDAWYTPKQKGLAGPVRTERLSAQELDRLWKQ